MNFENIQALSASLNVVINDATAFSGVEDFYATLPKHISREIADDLFAHVNDYTAATALAFGTAGSTFFQENPGEDVLSACFQLPMGNTVDHVLHRDYVVGDDISHNYMVSGLSWDLGAADGALMSAHKMVANMWIEVEAEDAGLED